MIYPIVGGVGLALALFIAWESYHDLRAAHASLEISWRARRAAVSSMVFAVTLLFVLAVNIFVVEADHSSPLHLVVCAGLVVIAIDKSLLLRALRSQRVDQ